MGLFGTVWGVINTFAGVAEAGEANLAAIAPGVASALACTLMGLMLAIPALFQYSYLSGGDQEHHRRHERLHGRVHEPGGRRIRGEGMRKNPYDDMEMHAELNVVPLLDLAWNLLIVFIMVVTATVQGINVNLPKASAATGNIKPATKAITITAEGTIYLDSFPVTLAELEARLKQLKAVNPNFPVVIKGDEKISYKSVIEVLDLLQRLEITQLGLVTQKLVK